MGLFDLFTGAPAIEAAEKSRNLLTQTQGNVANRTNTAAGQAEGFLNTGYGNARNDLTQGYNTSVGRISDGAGDAIGYINGGQSGALGQLGQARTDLTAGGGAYAPLSALADRYKAGGTTYADSLGLNGPEGNTRAVGAFQAGPGYEFQLQSGIDALNRRANAGGMLVGGNANRDAITFAQGLANKEYGGWQDRLKGMSDQELQATGAAAAGNQANNTTLAGLGVQGANLLNAGGMARAGVATTQGQNLADLARQYYSGLGQASISQGGALAGNVTGAANQINSADLNIAPRIGQTFQDEAQASLTGQKNLWNLGMQGASALAGMPGGGSSFLPSSSFLTNGFNPGGSQGVW